jgi:RNA polymerase sigma-54 factor
MEINQKQNLTQGMRQEQVMTHQQIQALEMLFLPVLELQALIDAELEKNPGLDTEPDAPTEVKVESDDDEWLDKVLKLDEENRFIKSSTGTNTYTSDDEEKRSHFLNSVTVEQTFEEFLLEQLRFLEISDIEKKCCEIVIAGLNDNAYLESHPADIAMAAGVGLDVVNKAIGIVQGLEPPGVAASDLRERLMIQIERKGLDNTPAYTIVDKYLKEIGSNHLPQVARKMKMSIDELKEQLAVIQNLTPRISTTEAVSPHEYIQEEVIVVEEEGRYVVKLKNEYLPSLYISKGYRDLLQEGDVPKETRDYVKDKIKSGVTLINSILQRQTTIKKIAQTIVDVQHDFFENGQECLKPLTMAQVAEKVGIHETTVSRAVANKYMRCKYGVLPLRGFFTTGYELDDGKTVSKNVVMEAIRKIIENEDSKSPLSDSAISKKLKDMDFNVARRTVAKYRENMNILPSNLRRQY